MSIKSILSGEKVFDWTVPLEWNVKDAWVKNKKGKKIIDFKKNNLHLVGYSEPINIKIKLKDLNSHLFSLKQQPKAIPYVTSYYKKFWGFCITHNERKKLKNEVYHIKIDSSLKRGKINYGEIIYKGKSSKEIFFSTYVCHPSMANNELSGPCISIFLTEWLSKIKTRFTYRFVYIPETIGSLIYLSKNLKKLKKNVIAGFNLSCCGDERTYSLLPSRKDNTLSDKIAKHVLRWTYKNYKCYNWSDRGSDERQYCAPGIDLPIASIMRSKYGTYPEYHTSLDNLKDVVTPKGLNDTFVLYQKVILALENNYFPKSTILGEPQMSKRDLYHSISIKNIYKKNNYIKLMMDFLAYSDGSNLLFEIADKCKVPVWELYPISDKLEKLKMIKKIF